MKRSGEGGAATTGGCGDVALPTGAACHWVSASFGPDTSCWQQHDFLGLVGAAGGDGASPDGALAALGVRQQ